MKRMTSNGGMESYLEESPMRRGRIAFAGIGGLLAIFMVVAWCAPAGTAWALAIVTLVPAATLGLGGAIFAVSQLRHQDEIVIQRGPERLGRHAHPARD